MMIEYDRYQAGSPCQEWWVLMKRNGGYSWSGIYTLEYNVPIETVSRALGHSNIKTTQIYAKITTTKMQRDYSNITGYAPWGVTYVNSADDPKNQKH